MIILSANLEKLRLFTSETLKLDKLMNRNLLKSSNHSVKLKAIKCSIKTVNLFNRISDFSSYAFIDFINNESAQLAVNEMNGKPWLGWNIAVQLRDGQIHGASGARRRRSSYPSTAFQQQILPDWNASAEYYEVYPFIYYNVACNVPGCLWSSILSKFSTIFSPL